jgi:hypothetical protein
MNPPFESILNAARLPAAVGEVLRLFQTDLSEVSFPAVGRAELEAAIESLGDQLRTVERSRALLHAEEAELLARKEALLRLCDRGLGYARVFASENEALSAKVDGMPGLRRRAEGASRPRQPRAEASDPETADAQLPLGHEVPEVAPERRPRRGRATRDAA